MRSYISNILLGVLTEFCCIYAWDPFTDPYTVTITNNGPIIIGANLTFTANLWYANQRPNIKPDDLYRFEWYDNTNPPNQAVFEGNITESNWTVTYSSPPYKTGSYEVEVIVKYKELFFFPPVCSNRTSFEIRGLLNGNLAIYQGNITRKDYISSELETKHSVKLSTADKNYLINNFNTIHTYWFIDCIYYGATSNFTSFTFNYTVPEKIHSIHALVVASNVIPIPTTTLAPTTSTTTSPSTTITPSTTTEAANITVTSVPSLMTSLSTTPFALFLNATETITKLEGSYYYESNGTFFHNNSMQVPYNCSAKIIVPMVPQNVYGLFVRDVDVKAPIKNVKTEGNFWLQHGDMLYMTVKCNGSGPYDYCVKFCNGVYNATGNETCEYWSTLFSCEFSIYHYFRNSTTYTVVIIIQNNVNTVVTPIGINVYEGTKQPQLSVIIVPVAASIVAVVLIMFGIAYYIQSKNRYIIEVADFDFSHVNNDLEYKTFRERLVEAISNACTNTDDYSEGDSNSGVPVTDRKYGIMH